MRTKHDEIKTIIGIMMELNGYYRLSDEHFISGVVDVLEKCGLADDSSEDALRLTVADIYRSQKVHQAQWDQWIVDRCDRQKYPESYLLQVGG